MHDALALSMLVRSGAGASVLRALLEEHGDAAAAFRAFAREPDVAHLGY